MAFLLGDGSSTLAVEFMWNLEYEKRKPCFNEVYDVKSVSLPDTAVICKQFFNVNDINRVRRVVLGFQKDGACTDFFEKS